jgi:hypothetical protein
MTTSENLRPKDRPRTSMWPPLRIDAWEWAPLVALVGGAWAFTAAEAWAGSDPKMTLVAALALILGGWMPWWRALTETPWRIPLSAWRTWEQAAPLPRWPYLQPGTPGAKLHRAMAQARAWWREVGRRQVAPALWMAARAMLISGLIAWFLGRTALLLTLLMLAWTEIAVLWHEGRGEVGTVWAAGAWVGFPWLLGASLSLSAVGVEGAASAEALMLPALSALVLMAMTALILLPSGWAAAGPALAGAFLLWRGHAFAAGIVLLLALPGLFLLLHHPDAKTYRRALLPWFLAMLILIASVL